MTIASLGKKYGVLGLRDSTSLVSYARRGKEYWSTIYNYYVDPRKSTWIKSSSICPIFGHYVWS